VTQPWLMWQLADSAFPAGGFAHSCGLEAAWQRGELAASAGLRSFLTTAVVQAGRGAVPLVTAACRAPERFAELDRLSEALLSNHVANRASRAQGRALLTAAERIFRTPSLSAFREEQDSSESRCHYAPAFGVVASCLGVGPDDAAELFVFVTLRGLVSAAVRLGAVGPLEGQAVQNALAPHAAAVVARCKDLAVEEAAVTSPLIDILHATHDRLYSRLFVT
jgi:urease accessory protein